MLKISEIFYSLQGEGKRIGVPSIFIRVGGCNFSCRGFGEKIIYKNQEIVGCDSIYAASQKYANEWMVFKDSKALIQKIKDFNIKHFDIVLTGGEPSLYFKNKVLLDTLEYFLERKHYISVESNGSILFDFNKILESLHFTLSIKLSNSLEIKEKRINLRVIQNILDFSKDVCFKFVLNQQMCKDGSGIKEINEILSCISGSYDVYLMPEGTDIDTINKNLKALVPVCLQYNFFLTDRLHIRLWGNKKGF